VLGPNVTWEFEGKERDVFTWHLMKDYNDYAVPRFQKIGADILYGDALTHNRPDSHAVPGGDADCLHYWLPGVSRWLEETVRMEQ